MRYSVHHEQGTAFPVRLVLTRLATVCQFTHLAQIEDTCLHQLGIRKETTVVQTITVVQDFICIGNQLFNDHIISHKQ